MPNIKVEKRNKWMMMTENAGLASQCFMSLDCIGLDCYKLLDSFFFVHLHAHLISSYSNISKKEKKVGGVMGWKHI